MPRRTKTQATSQAERIQKAANPDHTIKRAKDNSLAWARAASNVPDIPQGTLVLRFPDDTILLLLPDGTQKPQHPGSRARPPRTSWQASIPV